MQRGRSKLISFISVTLPYSPSAFESLEGNTSIKSTIYVIEHAYMRNSVTLALFRRSRTSCSSYNALSPNLSRSYSLSSAEAVSTCAVVNATPVTSTVVPELGLVICVGHGMGNRVVKAITHLLGKSKMRGVCCSYRHESMMEICMQQCKNFSFSF